MTTVAYIGGLGRSGSTLLERIAGRFEGVTVLGEVVHVWARGVVQDEACSCGQPFSRCEFWQEIGVAAFGGWHTLAVDRVLDLATRVDRTRFIPSLLHPRAGSVRAGDIAEYGQYYAAVYAAAAKLTAAEVIADSSKHPSTAYVLRRAAGVNLRVVHLVRDSRGVAYSWTKLQQRPEAHEGSADMVMHQYPPWRAAVLWDAHNIAFAALRRSGVPVWRLHYERLMNDPVAAANSLAEFIGVPGQRIEEFLTRDTLTIGPAHQIAGNHMRFQTGAISLRRDDEWRARLPTRDRRLVTAITAPLMQRYGYFNPDGDALKVWS